MALKLNNALLRARQGATAVGAMVMFASFLIMFVVEAAISGNVTAVKNISKI